MRRIAVALLGVACSSGGGPLRDVVLTGLLTTPSDLGTRVRSLRMELGVPVGEDAPCDEASLLCRPCSGDTCLDFELARLTMTGETMAPPLEARTADDIAADPACGL